MNPSPKPRGLGRGLSALLGDEDIAATIAPSSSPASSPAVSETPHPAHPSRSPFTLPIAQLKPGRMQPRTVFEDKDGLVESVRRHGLLQPVLVRPLHGEPGVYEIVAGERRWRAAQKAQLHEVPVVVRALDDLDSLQLALIENLQRTDLSPIDEAMGYRRLMDQFNQTQEQVAETMGRSRPHIANTLRLLDLPAEVRDMVQRHELTAGQARSLLSFSDPTLMAERAVKEKLSVRELERLAAGERPASKKARTGKPATSEGAKTADTKALEKRIEEALGLKASLALRGLGEQSVLTLDIRDYDQLDLVVERLTRR